MAKKVQAVVKLHIPAGQATPAPPVGPALAQHGVNMGEFTSKFNEATQEKQGFKIPVEIIVYEDRTFDMVLHEPPVAELIKKEIGIEKGSGTPNRKRAGVMKEEQVRKIAEAKISDLNTDDVDQAVKTVKGTAKSMGVVIE